MPMYAERSAAKINLTLKILGKRPDGYHELRSLVVFGPDASDVVTLDTDAPETLTIAGPFAAKLDGENILTRTLSRVREASLTPVALGTVRLEKNLPVAAGLGGGSANAAALLRAIRRANPHLASVLDWHTIARELGADVPVCLASRASVMTGIGEILSPIVPPLPELYAVLANPNVPVPHDKTARVFRALAAPPLKTGHSEPLTLVTSADGISNLMARDGNDLAAAAADVVPELASVIDRLRAEPDSIACAVSGAGPTAFALFSNRTQAVASANRLRAESPSWWIAETRLE